LNADRDESETDGVQWAEHVSGQQASKINTVPQGIAEHEEKGVES